MTALKLEICSTAAASVPCMSDLRIEGSPAPGRENKEAAEQVVLRSRGQQGIAEISAPVFSFFGGGEEEEEPEIHVVEDPILTPTSAPVVDCEPPQDFLDSITDEVRNLQFKHYILLFSQCVDAKHKGWPVA